METLNTLLTERIVNFIEMPIYIPKKEKVDEKSEEMRAFALLLQYFVMGLELIALINL